MTQHPEEGTLHAYIDGELTPAESAALEQHVGECAACAAALAEARGFVAASSRVITALDAAPASVAEPAASVVPRLVPAPRAKRVASPAFRMPYARAAALLLLVGGTAFVFNRAGSSARGTSPLTESVTADAAALSELTATAPAEAPTAAVAAPTRAPDPAAAGTTLPAGTDRSKATGGARRESAAPRRAGGTTMDDGVAGGVVTKDAVPAARESTSVARRDATTEVAKSTTLAAAPPPPARMTTAAHEREAAVPLNLVPPVVRYRTRDGVIVTLTEEPLRTAFAEESLAARQSMPAPARQRMAAAAAASTVNTYRWSSVEQGKTFALSGPLTVAELEALSRRLGELERVP